MFGRLPKSITIQNKEYSIRTDYRDCLLIIIAFSDIELNDTSKAIILLDILYKDEIPEGLEDKALEKGVEFLDGGIKVDTNKPNTKPEPMLYDWEQDEQIIFSAINKVAGREIRNDDYMHWWTFIGLFNEIGESTFSSVVSIRNKKHKHKKLDDGEKEFYRKNKDMIDLKKKLTLEEEEMRQHDLLALEELLGKE